MSEGSAASLTCTTCASGATDAIVNPCAGNQRGWQARLHGGLAAQALLEVAHQPQRQVLLVHPEPQWRRLQTKRKSWGLSGAQVLGVKS